VQRTRLWRFHMLYPVCYSGGHRHVQPLSNNLQCFLNRVCVRLHTSALHVLFWYSVNGYLPHCLKMMMMQLIVRQGTLAGLKIAAWVLRVWLWYWYLLVAACTEIVNQNVQCLVHTFHVPKDVMFRYEPVPTLACLRFKVIFSSYISLISFLPYHYKYLLSCVHCF